MVFEDCGNCIAMEQSGYIIYIVSKRTVWEAKIMKKITSAYANKMLRSLEEDKAFWVNKEAASSTYVAAVNEEPVIPEYDYMTIANTIDEIDRKIVTIKHTLNLTNATAKVQVGNQEMSIDSILIRMAQRLTRERLCLTICVRGFRKRVCIVIPSVHPDRYRNINISTMIWK